MKQKLAFYTLGFFNGVLLLGLLVKYRVIVPILFLTCTFGFSQGKIDGAFVGLSTGPNKAFQVDVAVPMFQAGYTAWGFHVSLDQRTPVDEAQTARYTNDKTLWGTQTSRENESRGGSFGGFLNVGRGFLAVGVSMVTQQTEVLKVLQDGTMITLQNQQTKSLGQYVKVGYHWGKATIYGGFNSHYKASLGVGFNW